MATRYVSFTMNEEIAHLRAHVIRNCTGRQQKVLNWYNLKQNDRVIIRMERVLREEQIKIEMYYHYTIMSVGYLMLAITETTAQDDYLTHPVVVVNNFLEIVPPILR